MSAMKRLICFLLPGLLFFMTSKSQAFEFIIPWTDIEASLDITETLVADFHDDNFDGIGENDDYGDIRNRLNLKLSIDDFELSTRFDTSTFIHRPANATPRYRDRYGLEKITAKYTSKKWQLSAGDFYASIGRSIALRVRKIDQLGEDTTLLGAKARFTGDLLEVTILSGLSNPANIDSVEEKSIKTPTIYFRV